MSDAIRCFSPIDGALVAERPAMPPYVVEKTVERAKAAQRDWAARPLSERIRLVEAGVAAFAAMADAPEELARMMGRPVRYGGEAKGVLERASYMASIAESALAPIEIADDAAFRRYVAREPHGIVLVIAPWNYPYLTAVNTVAPALIAGNAVLLKAAAQTLLSGERLARAFHSAGVPETLFQPVHLSHAGTAELIRSRACGFVNFTGSVGGGRAIEQAAAGTFIGLGLELGGKDPGYVMEDADLDAAAETLIDGAMFNSGQCCCGIERIYVAAPLFDRFVEKAVAICESYVLGDPLDRATTLGPMAQARFADLVRAQTADAVGRGATALVDPKRFPDRGGCWLGPQVLTGVTHDMDLMREENFGPVVGIMKVESDAEAIRLMNDSRYGLTASLWTRDIERAERVGRQVETGTVFMNRCDYLDPALCWTGCKDTGRGAALSVLGYAALTRPKSFHLKKPQ